jgi:hypothetical protein
VVEASVRLCLACSVSAACHVTLKALDKKNPGRDCQKGRKERRPVLWTFDAQNLQTRDKCIGWKARLWYEWVSGLSGYQKRTN